MDLDYAALGEAIRRSRILADLTQQALADRAGVSRATISNLESGRVPLARIPTSLRDVARSLGWPAERAAEILRGGQVTADDLGVRGSELPGTGPLVDAGVLDLSQYDDEVQAEFIFVCRGYVRSRGLVERLRQELLHTAEAWKKDHSARPR